jgi:chromosome segregation ATPase
MMQDQLYRQLKEIHQSKHKHDTLLSELQRATDRLTKKELSHEQLKKEQTAITSLYGQVKAACHKNSETLMEIKVQLMKLRSHERLDVNR